MLGSKVILGEIGVLQDADALQASAALQIVVRKAEQFANRAAQTVGSPDVKAALVLKRSHLVFQGAIHQSFITAHPARIHSNVVATSVLGLPQ